MATYHIGGDVDNRITELAVLSEREVQPRHLRVPTTIPSLREALLSVPGRRVFVIEEGGMADWLYRNLHGYVDEMIVCDPRRNKLVSHDGDKDNRIDARKLAELSRSGLLRPVYHSDSQEHVVLKQWVSLYHDRVREGVREVNKLRARCRSWGLRMPARALRNQAIREEWLKKVDNGLADQLRVLLFSLDVMHKQVALCRRELARRAGGKDIISRWQKVPGIGLIRAVTFLAYMDTPWRFGSRNKVWRYCGVGLQRYATGTDRWGRPRVGKLQLAWQANKRLKAVIVGATMSAINRKDNAISEYYRKAVSEGMSRSHARHTASRKLLDRMMAMWKTGSEYSPDLA